MVGNHSGFKNYLASIAAQLSLPFSFPTGNSRLPLLKALVAIIETTHECLLSEGQRGDEADLKKKIHKLTIRHSC